MPDLFAKQNFLSVGEYLDTINSSLAGCGARVIGEITDIQLYPGRSYLFFKIKDKDENDPAVLSCFMWKRDYDVCGVKLETGLEIVATGMPNIYKPLGRLSFNVSSVEFVGEGALKKQYEKLKMQLEREGLFSESRKRLLPELPQQIGLITSKDGAAIGDFQVNLGKYGFKISFIDSRVEGQLATQDLLNSVRSFKNKNVDVLVLIRGGGSLESLLPFNNEVLVREIADFPVPVLVGVGHEKDISLVGLVADRMVSTPTAAAEALNDSWQELVTKIDADERKIFSHFERTLSRKHKDVDDVFITMKANLQLIFDRFNRAEEVLQRSFISVRSRMSELLRSTDKKPQEFAMHMKAILGKASHYILTTWKILETYDPKRQLKLGYSIVQSGGLVVRKVEQIHVGQSINVRVQDGSFVSEVKVINNNGK